MNGMCRSNVIIYQNETKFEIYCNDKTESYHITEKNLKVSINTITWLRTKFLIIHTVTLRGIVNVENIYMLYCDLFSCDLLFCDFYFRLPFMYCRYIISHSLDEMYEHQISILLKFHVLPWKDKLLSVSVIVGS